MTELPRDVMLTRDGRPAVRMERWFPHPAEKVWRAISRPEHLGAWFPSPVEIDLRTGGAMRFAAFAGDAAEYGQVLAVDPPHRLEFSWGDDRMILELRTVDGGTALTLVHVFDDRAGAASFATGWHGCLVGLRHVLADEPVPTADRGVQRHEDLVVEFGLDQPTVEQTADGWRIRFERQLTCPAERAWDLFLGVDQLTGEQRQAPAVGQPLTPYAAPTLILGTVTELTEHRLLAFVTAPGEPGDHVRVELTEGTGHGARLIVTVTGTESAQRDLAIEQWGAGAVEQVAREAARTAVQPS